jgi:hypothetical protein
MEREKTQFQKHLIAMRSIQNFLKPAETSSGFVSELVLLIKIAITERLLL